MSHPCFAIARLHAVRLIALVATLMAIPPLSAATGAGNVEVHIKAAYLFNFGRYVSWPQQTGDVVIGVVGHAPIVEILEQTVAGKTINGRAYRVRVYSATEPIDHCDILFLSHGDIHQTASILTALAGKPVLTVSDTENFAGQGGMVEFLLVDDTLKFDINLAAVEKCGLKISSELLRVAHEIKGRRR
ncbi:MAG TPA: YfiR family protein [Bryobacteraceae bacterium]